jgi:hypothetical protein
MIHGTFEDVYKIMPHFCAYIEVINSGSIASLEEIFIHRCGYFYSFQNVVVIFVVSSNVVVIFAVFPKYNNF